MTAVAFNHRGTLLASLGADETVRLWIPATGRLVTLNLAVDPAGRIRFSTDDLHLIGADEESLNPRVWEVLREVLTVLPVQTGIGDDVRTIDFSPDNSRLLAASAKQITFWDTRSGRETGIVPHANSRSAWFTADSQHLIASGDRGLLKWPLIEHAGAGLPCLRTGPEQQMYGAFDYLGTMALSLDRAKAAVIHQGEVVVVTTEAPAAAALKTHRLGAHYPQIALHPKCTWVATRKANSSSVHLWDLSNASPDLVPADVPGSKYFSFSPDGNWFAICSAGVFQFFRVGVWDKHAFTIPRMRVSDQHAPVAFSSDGRLVAVAAARYVIQLFRLPEPGGTEHELIATLESPDRLPLALLAFRPDGRQLAAATDGQLIQLWNLAWLRDELAALDLQGTWPAFPSK